MSYIIIEGAIKAAIAWHQMEKRRYYAQCRSAGLNEQTGL